MISKSNGIIATSLILTLLVTGSVYWQGLDGPFLLDDFSNVVEAHVDYFDRDEIYYALTHNFSGELGRSVSVLSLIFSGIVHGPEAWGYKYHNLAIHLLNGLLIFWLLVQLLPKMLHKDPVDSQVILIAGLAVSMWLLHPLQVSTVLYVVQRMAQLAAFFTLSSLIVYIKAREYSSAGGIKFYLLAYLLFPMLLGLAVFSKENGALTIFYVLAIELTAFGFKVSSINERNRIGIFLGLFVGLPIILASGYVVLNFEQLSDYSMRNFTLGERLLTQLHVVAFYIKMIVFPRLSDMTLFHDYFQVTTGFDFITIILFLLLLTLVFLVFYLRNRLPVVSFAIAWFFVSHLMESTIFNLELVFEHRNYLAALGPLLLMVYGLCKVPTIPKLKYVNGAILLLLVFLTFSRVQEWRSSELIYQVAIEEHPDSNRVLTLMANLKYRQGEFQSAWDYLQMAQANNDKEYGTLIHEAIYRCGTGIDFTPYFDEALEKAVIYPASAYTLNVLNNTVSVINNSRCPELKNEDMLNLLSAVKSQEGNINNEYFFGILEKIEGQLLLIEGNYGKGIGLMISAYDKTGRVLILVNLAENLIDLNLLGDAEYIISLIEGINLEEGGKETAILLPLVDKLLLAKNQIQLVQKQEPDTN